MGDLTSVPDVTLGLPSLGVEEGATLTIWFELESCDLDTLILVSLLVYSISVKLNSF